MVPVKCEAAHRSEFPLITSVGWCIPTSQFSCDPEFLRLQHRDSLELNCGSHCNSYAWWKISMASRDDERVPIDFSGAILTKTAVEYGDGGQYICKCLPDTSSRECSYTVSGESLVWPGCPFYSLVLLRKI